MNLINSFIQWFANHPEVLIGIGISSIFILLVSILGIGWFVAQIPQDYFLPSKRQTSKWQEQKPILRFVFVVGKNNRALFDHWRSINVNSSWPRFAYNSYWIIIGQLPRQI